MLCGLEYVGKGEKNKNRSKINFKKANSCAGMKKKVVCLFSFPKEPNALHVVVRGTC